MAGRLTNLTGAVLAAVVVVGTCLYIAGIAPPFPWNACAFHGMVLGCLAFALVAGKARAG